MNNVTDYLVLSIAHCKVLTVARNHRNMCSNM